HEAHCARRRRRGPPRCSRRSPPTGWLGPRRARSGRRRARSRAAFAGRTPLSDGPSGRRGRTVPPRHAATATSVALLAPTGAPRAGSSTRHSGGSGPDRKPHGAGLIAVIFLSKLGGLSGGASPRAAPPPPPRTHSSVTHASTDSEPLHRGGDLVRPRRAPADRRAAAPAGGGAGPGRAAGP